MPTLSCPFCHSTLAVGLTPAQVTPATMSPAVLTPEVVVPAQVTGLMLVAPPPQPVETTPLGVPLGLFGPASPPFTLMEEANDPATIVTRIADVRAKGQRLLLALAGGKHSNYMSLIGGVLRFDPAKWRARIDAYNTPAIIAAIASGVADGTVLGFVMIDEPNNKTGDNSWGPDGTITKAMLDDLATYARAIFPTLPIGYQIGPRGYLWQATERSKNLDFICHQYNWWITKGDVVTWRDAVLAGAALEKVSVVFSLNILNGGTITSTGAASQMTAAQIREYGLKLAPYCSALMSWKYDSAFFGNQDVQQAYKDIAALLATLPFKGCRRTT